MKVLSLRRETLESSTGDWALTDAFTLAAFDQGNEAIARDEMRTHRALEGLREQVVQVDAALQQELLDAAQARQAWHDHGAPVPKPFLPDWVVIALLLVVSAGECLLAASAFRGLDFLDWETWIAGAGVLATSTLLCKALAYGGRGIVHRKTGSSLRRSELAWAATGVAGVLALLLGMAGVRRMYAAAEAASGGTLLSDTAQAGLFALQLALLAAQAVAFYFLTPAQPEVEAARKAWLRSCTRTRRLRGRRARLEARFNATVGDFQSRRKAHIAYCRRIVLEYRRTLARCKRQDMLAGVDARLREDWFMASPAWRLPPAAGDVPIYLPISKADFQ